MIAAVHSLSVRLMRQYNREARPPVLRPMVEWSEAEVVVPSGPYEDFPYRVDRLPYARLLLNEIGKWQRHIITGPTQSGKSFHAFVLVIMYYLFERQEDVIVGVPDINMAADKWTEDIKPVIERSSYAHLLPKQGGGSRGGGKLEKVKFGNGRFLRFLSAGGNDKQRAGATARVLVVTETDGMDLVAGTSQEGQTKIQQLEGRVRAFGDRAVRFFECTVSTENAFTWSNYQSGTASRIVHQCKGCDAWVSPEREHLVGWHDAKDAIEAGEKAAFSCPECGICYSEEDRLQMNQNGKLVHKGQEVTPGGEIVGESPRTRTLGFRWSAFQNLLYTTATIAEEEWEAANAEDPEIADIARNQQAWAIPAENPNVDKVEIGVAIVRGSEPGYEGRVPGVERGVIPDGTATLTAGIDCSMRFLQWVVEAKHNKQIHVVDYGYYETPDHEIVDAEKAVERGIREITAKLTDVFPDLHAGLVDSGNWTESVLRTVASIGGIWKPSHGLSDYKHPAKNFKGKRLPSDGSRSWHYSLSQNTWVVNFDPNMMKHRVHSGFLIRPTLESGQYVPGAVTLFGDDPEGHTTYAKQICAEEWISEFVKGKGIQSRWKQVRRDNHYLDASVLAMVARGVVKSQREQRRHQKSRQYGVLSKK